MSKVKYQQTLGQALLLLVCLSSTASLAEDAPRVAETSSANVPPIENLSSDKFAFVDDLEELDCVIEPHVVIDLSSRVDGIVETMEVERGELIEKGQVLVRLESGVEQAAVAQAKVRAEAMAEILASNISADFAERRNDRIAELHRSDAVSTDQLDEIKTEYELSRLQRERAQENQLIAQLELRQARAVLARHTLRSPIRGIVVQHYLAPGEAVEEQPIMRIAQIDPLRVEVIVPVAQFGTIKVGQHAIMRPEPPMEGEFETIVTIVDGVADASSGTFRVRLGLPNEDYGLPSGLRCRVGFLPVEEEPETVIVAVPDPEPESVAVETPVTSEASLPEYEMVKTAVATVDSAANRCQTIGPIMNASDADAIMVALTGQATQLRLREENRSSSESYMLLAPPQPSREDSVARTKKMQAAGFSDFYIFWRGPHVGRISLGVHRNKKNALNRQTWLSERGFESEIVLRTESRSDFWLDVQLLPQITGLDLAAAGQALGKSGFAATACEAVVNREQTAQKLAGTSTLH